MGHQVLEVSVPLEGLHICALVVRIDLLGLEEVGPEFLRLELLGVLLLKVKRSQLDCQLFGLWVCLDHADIKFKIK